jgi:hypothetical protein
MSELFRSRQSQIQTPDALKGIGHIHITFPKEWFAQLGLEVNEAIVKQMIEENVLTKPNLKDFEVVRVANINNGDFKVMMKRRYKVGGNVLDFGRIEIGGSLSLLSGL